MSEADDISALRRGNDIAGGVAVPVGTYLVDGPVDLLVLMLCPDLQLPMIGLVQMLALLQDGDVNVRLAAVAGVCSILRHNSPHLILISPR